MSVGIPILGNFSWYNGEMESSQFERRIFLGDTCSWWGQLEKNEKLKTFKFESLKLNWKEWSWKFRAKVGNFWITWHCLKTFQLRLVLVNFDGNFLTTDFQIQNFPTSRFSNVSLREIEVGEKSTENLNVNNSPISMRSFELLSFELRIELHQNIGLF